MLQLNTPINPPASQGARSITMTDREESSLTSGRAGDEERDCASVGSSADCAWLGADGNKPLSKPL